jgi:hypothetical protein
MGYRSDIRAVFYDTSETPISGEQVKAWIKTNFPDVFRHWPEDGHWGVEDHVDGEMVVFEVTGVKWYDNTYEDVIAFEQMLKSDKFKPNDRVPGDVKIAWEFGRIGEDYDDAELRQSRNMTGNIRIFIRCEFGWF